MSVDKECVNKNLVRDEVEEAVRDKLYNTSIPRGLVGGLAGSFVDDVIDNDPNNDDGWLFAVAGLALGSGRVTTKTMHVLNGFKKKAAEKFPELTSQIDLGRKTKAAEDIHALGGKVDVGDVEEVSVMNKAISALRGAKDGSGKALDAFFNSEWAESSFSMLNRLPGKAAKKFSEAMMGVNVTLNKMTSAPKRKFSKLLYERGLDDMTVDQMREQYGSKLIKDLYNGEISDKRALASFNDSIHRLISTGRGGNNERLIPQIERIYNDTNFGDFARKMDDKLANDEYVQAYIDSHRSFFTNIMDDWHGEVLKRMNEALSVVKASDEEKHKYLTEYIASGESRKEFVAGLNGDQRIFFEKMMEGKDGDLVKQVLDYKKTMDRFTGGLDERYFPQIMSDEKLAIDRRRFITRAGLENASEDEVTKQYSLDLARRVKEANSSEADKYLKRYNQEEKTIGNYESFRKATVVSKLESLANDLRRAGRLEDATKLAGNVEDFIEGQIVKMTDKTTGEFIKTKTGKIQTKTKYRIKIPEGFDVKMFDEDNVKVYEKFTNDLLKGALVKQSNFLERPRVRYLPTEILETNLDKAMTKYVQDVGRRIHFTKNNMFDEEELNAMYVKSIISDMRNAGYSEKDIRKTEDRIVSIYNIANNVIGKSSDNIDNLIKTRQIADIVRNTLFSAFGYGFTWYNLFEWAVVGPHISSWDAVKKSFKYFSDKQTIDNVENLMTQLNIIRNEIGAMKPEYENFGTVSQQFGNLEMLQKFTGASAQWVNEFSITSKIMDKMGYDIKNIGLGRLAFDSFQGSNSLTSSMNGMASLVHANELATVARKIKNLDEGVEKVVKSNGRTYTEKGIRDDLARLGITEDRFDAFIENQGKLEDFIGQLSGGEKLNIKDFASDGNYGIPDHYDDVFTILQNATETYHGTNRLYRPESWNTPVGKMLSMYSTYPFNFAFNHVQRRVRKPINEWFEKYGEQLPKEMRNDRKIFSLTPYQILNHMKKGEMSKLRELGMTKEMIEEFPVDAYHNVVKHFSTFGVATAGYLSVDAINDVLAYPVNETIGDEEQWKRLKRWKVLNPSADPRDQITFGDLDAKYGMRNVTLLANYAMGMAARTSVFGRYGDLISQRSFLSRDGIMSLTPVTDVANETFKKVFEVTRHDIGDWGTSATREGIEMISQYGPLIGAKNFTSLRKAALHQLDEKFYSENGKHIQFRNSATGELFGIDQAANWNVE